MCIVLIVCHSCCKKAMATNDATKLTHPSDFRLEEANNPTKTTKALCAYDFNTPIPTTRGRVNGFLNFGSLEQADNNTAKKRRLKCAIGAL